MRDLGLHRVGRPGARLEHHKSVLKAGLDSLAAGCHLRLASRLKYQPARTIPRGPHPGYVQLDTLLNGIRPAWYVVEGESGLGKSTFVSALWGDSELLPTAVRDCTQTNTLIREPRDDESDRSLLLAYLDRDDIVTQTMAAFVSTTANCARCHTHKFDPFSMQDYHGLAGIFASTKTYFGTAVSPANRVGGDPLPLPLHL